MSWTDERINLLKKMWKEGKSAAEIAKTLGKGVTRNAVIGKAHRMGLSGRPSPIKKPVPVKKDALKKEKESFVAGKKQSATTIGGKVSQLAKEAAEYKKPEKEVIPPGGGVGLIELTEKMCKWPIGDPRDADFCFCGRTSKQGTPYCPEHVAAAYQTSSRRSSAAAAAIANEDKDVVVEVVVADDDEAVG